MWRVASTPFIPGMFRSITTTSGAVSRTIWRACEPPAASPTISDPLALEQVSEPGPEQVVIVDQEDANVVLLGLRAESDLVHQASGRGVDAGKSRRFVLVGRPSPSVSPALRQRRVITTVRRPQRSAAALVGNQRSITAPRIAPPVSAATASP